MYISYLFKSLYLRSGMFSWTEKALGTPNTQFALYVVYKLQWISLPTSPCSLWHAGSNASTAGWSIWIIYPCRKDYSAELATACNERHKEWACGISVWVLTGWILGYGSMLYSQVLHWIMYPYVLNVSTALTNQLIDLIGHYPSSSFTWKRCFRDWTLSLCYSVGPYW